MIIMDNGGTHAGSTRGIHAVMMIAYTLYRFWCSCWFCGDIISICASSLHMKLTMQIMQKLKI